MELLLFRHGPAESKTDWHGDDVERPLTADGRLLVHDVATSLARQKMLPDLILTSPFARAQQTAQIVADCLGRPDRLQVDERIAPGFGTKQLARLLRDHHDIQSIMLIGHDPDLTDLLRALTGGGRITIRKAGVAQIDIPDPHTMKGRLVALFVPAPLNPVPDNPGDSG